MSDRPIYLDFNATTPIDPAVADAMLPYLYEHFGNPSSSHSYGVTARSAVERARQQVASLIGARPEEIVFTSGGSESNNTVIRGVAAAQRSRGRHLVTTAIEHPAVIEPFRALEAEGYRLTVVGVDEKARVDPADIERALTPETLLVSVMHANNEVGTLQDIAAIAEITRRHGVFLHTDAAQSVGKIPVRVRELGVDYLSLAGHKLYAPKGIGALYLRTGRDLPSFLYGADHEAGRRAGTENVLEIVGLGRACELAEERLEDAAAHAGELRDRLWSRLHEDFPDLTRNGDASNCLPNTLSVSFPGVEADTLLAEIGDRVAASAGAACHAEGIDLSTVLEAMGIPVEVAMGTLRLSLGRTTTAEEIDEAARVITQAVGRLGGTSAPTDQPRDEEIRLTRFTHGMGCACKLRPQELEQVLQALPPSRDPAVLVDMSTADDAAVYRLREDLAIVQTVDFFTPIADDPFDFGAISAANSLSDIYAMGARPVVALSIVGFPSQRLPLSVLSRILEGASEVAREAGIDIVGGHSVEDSEPKFGLAVTGVVHPDRLLTNAGAQPGAALILTKPLGTGIVATAVKQGIAAPDVAARALAVMRSLNREAAEAMLEIGAFAATDVTGFGLLGHLHEMAAASGVDVEIDFDSIPILTGARELAAAGVAPGGSLANLEHTSSWVQWPEHLSRIDRILLADAQTSGGLLIALDAQHAESLLERLHQKGIEDARQIGRFTTAGQGSIRVISEQLDGSPLGQSAGFN